MKSLLACIVAGLFAVVGYCAEDAPSWPQFRGPEGSGIAEGQTPPVEFGPETNVKWKVEAPGGLSSPIVAGDNLVLTAFEDGKLYTIAYNRADGAEAWRAEAPATEIEKYYPAEGSPAASTPATDGERIVSYFGSCGLICYDLAGHELWRYELPVPVLPGNFGSGVSPIIADGIVVLVRDAAEDSKIIAIDIASGELKWERPRQSPVSYSTPVVWETPQGKQIVTAGHARMVAYDLKSGEETWSISGIPSGCCSSPVTLDGMLLFAGWSPGGPDDPESQMPRYDDLLKDLDKDGDGALSREEAEAAFQGFFDAQDANSDGAITRDEHEAIEEFMRAGANAAFALEPGVSGEVAESQMLWKQTKGLPYIPSAIAYQGQYVMVKDGGIVTAYDVRSGEQIYMKRGAEGGRYYASPVAANGNIYFVSLEDGVVTVVKAGGNEPELVMKNAALGERVAATPAIADDTIYIRTEGHLYAFAEKQ